jgi:hypothetical protein
MSLVVAPNAVQHARLTEMAAAADTDVKNVRCILQFAQLVAKTPWFLSSPVATNLYIAEIASNHSPATTGKTQ